MNDYPVWPTYDEDEVEAAAEVLRSGKVNYRTGSQGKTFEADYGAAHGMWAVSVANGTLALELALAAFEIGPGDEVIVPCRTFVASASAIAMRGAKPVISDVDLASGNLSAATIEPHLTEQTKALIPVHMGGLPCEIDPILKLAQKHGLKVIEDCAQAHGAHYKDKIVGSLGDAAAFSFCQDKIMTTGGEGGMTLFREEGVWEKARSFRDHGKDYPLLASLSGSNSFPWPHRSIGSNYRLTEMQSAIGRIQLQKLTGWLEKRRANALLFEQIFQGHPAIQTIPIPDYMTHAHYRFYGRFNRGWDRDAILAKVRAVGVPMERGVCGQIQKEKAFTAWPDIHEREYPGGASWHDHGFALPTHPTLKEKHITRMADVLLDVLDSCEP